MLTPFQPRGIFSAQWIPVDAHGRIDRNALSAHLAFERAAGISGVLVLGSTGEFPYFSVTQRKDVLTAMAELAAPLPLIANVSDVRPQVAVELGHQARELGYQAIALMPPMFYPMSQADILAYFLHVADVVQLPVMLYNFPELAGKRIDPETVAAFAERAPMAAIKQSGREFAYHEQLIALGREKRFVVMSGADTRLPDVFKLGAAGCIGGLVNLVPELMVAIHRSATGAAPADISAAQRCMVELGRRIDQLTFPLNVAAGLEARGFNPGRAKSIVSPTSRRLYTQVTDQLRALFAETGLAPAAAPASLP